MHSKRGRISIVALVVPFISLLLLCAIYIQLDVNFVAAQEGNLLDQGNWELSGGGEWVGQAISMPIVSKISQDLVSPVAMDVYELSADEYDGDTENQVTVAENSNWDQIDKVVASDGSADDWFGNRVAIDGNIGVVGAKRDDSNGTDSGAVYIVIQDAFGNWNEESKLVASDGTADSLFGGSIAISGDTLVVGAYGDSEKGSSAGAVYVFVYDGNNWIQQAKLTASDAAAGDQFGHSVSISGGTIVAGAYQDDDKGTDSGSAYIFIRNGNSWIQQSKLAAGDGADGDWFGYSVSISGDTVATGAVHDDDQGVDFGSVYIYQRNGSTWTQQTKLLADDGLADGGYPLKFGISVSIDVDLLLVGAFGGDGTVNDTGSAYVFVRDGSNWTQQAKLLADDGEAGDYFGWGVSIDDDMAVVGALFNDELGADAGAAYVFERSGSSWSMQSKLIAPDGKADARLGRSVAFSHHAILIGAEGDDTNGTLSGAVYFFEPMIYWLPNGILSPTPDDDIDQTPAQYGWKVDIDNDVMVTGAPFADVNGITSSGYVDVLRHDGNRWVCEQRLYQWDTPDVLMERAYFGRAMSVSGNRLAIGAPRVLNNGLSAGAVYLFTYDGNSWVYEDVVRASDPNTDMYYGFDVMLDGDRLIVGAHYDDEKGNKAGAAYIYDWNGTGWQETTKLIASNGYANNYFGYAVGLDEDVAVVSAFGYGSDTGAVYVYRFNGSSWVEEQVLQGLDSTYSDRFGWDIDISNNVIAAGAYYGDETATNAGAAYLFNYDGNTWTQTTKLMASDGQANDYFGSGVALNDMGQELVVGAYGDDDIAADAGSAYFFALENGSWQEKQKLVESEQTAAAEFGRKVALDGNYLAVGARFQGPSTGQNGAVFAYKRTVTSVVPVNCMADVFVDKTVSNATILPGQPITYTLNFGNNGSDIAFNTMITDVVPAEVQNLTIVNSGIAITPTGIVPYAWQVGDMAVGEGGTITITAIISPELMIETTIVNTVEITSSLDVTTTNNVDTAVSQVIIPEISFSPSNYTANESAGSITVTAVLSPAQPFMDVFVDYETMAGTAVADQDYAPVSGTLTFPQGITETTMAIPILDNAIPEPDRTFSLALNNPVHAILNNSSATITILDDDIPPTESVVFLPIILNMPAEPEPDFPLFIGEAIASRPVTVSGEVFFSTTLNIPPTLSETGLFFLSSDQDQLTEIVVDDEFAILLDGEEVFVYTFSSVGHPPQSMIVEIPRSVMEPLAGQAITVVYRDVFSHAVSASAIWLQYIP